jgi:hypothetical protein
MTEDEVVRLASEAQVGWECWVKADTAPYTQPTAAMILDQYSEEHGLTFLQSIRLWRLTLAASEALRVRPKVARKASWTALTDAQKVEVVRLLISGSRAEDLAAEFRVGVNTIRRAAAQHFHERGIARKRGQPYTEAA